VLLFDGVKKMVQTRKLMTEEMGKLRYFFSLAMEDYFGDKKELMRMADIDEELLARFFDGEMEQEARE